MPHTISITVDIFNDAVTGLFWAENQLSLVSSDTLVEKKRFQQ